MMKPTSDQEICQCGDRRGEHENGTGYCLTCSASAHMQPFPICEGFRPVAATETPSASVQLLLDAAATASVLRREAETIRSQGNVPCQSENAWHARDYERWATLIESLLELREADQQEIARLQQQLARCYQLTGADTDSNDAEMLAPHAVAEVERLRADHDAYSSEVLRQNDIRKRLLDDLAKVTQRAESAQQQITALQAEVERQREALVKVRAHTAYGNTSTELLTGLLQSIERIVDAALRAQPPQEPT